MIRLTSTKNPMLQRVRRAAAAGRPTDEGLIAAEGPHLLEEAKRGAWDIEQLFVTAQSQEQFAHLFRGLDAEVFELSSRAFAATASTNNPQEVLALLRPRHWQWPELTVAPPLLIVLDGVQDPGNAGTIVRSAEAFGATGVIFLDGCVRIANPKFLRATAGSIFRLPYLDGMMMDDFLRRIRSSGIALFALRAEARTTITEADLQNGCALVVGGEGSGVSPVLASEAHSLSIPTTKVESLNAAIACSIALFEAHRQRRANERILHQ